LGSTYVLSLAYISSNVLIINFFLFAFFWVFVEPVPFEAAPTPTEVLEESPKFPSPFIFSSEEEKPYLITYVEEIGLDEFDRRIAQVGNISSLKDIE